MEPSPPNEPAEIDQTSIEPKKHGWIWRMFHRKRAYDENYDKEGKFVPREKVTQQLYTDYYGPIVEDEHGHRAGQFFHKEFETFGRPNWFGEIVIVLLFIIYFGYGIYNLYYVGGVIRDAYHDSGLDIGAYSYFLKFAGYGLLILLALWILSLAISYFIVRIISEIVGILMYLLAILEIGLLVVLYWKIKWEYNWVFLVAAIPNLLLLTVFNKKFRKGIYVLRMTTLGVAKQREILTPQITQTLWILLLSIFHIITSLETFLNVNPISEYHFELENEVVTINKGVIYAVYSLLFIFLIFVIYYVSSGMKTLMIHHWYRGKKSILGRSMGFWHAYGVIRRRWWGVFVYAMASTIIHAIQVIPKMLKKQFGPKNVKECFTLTGELIPTQVNAVIKKKGTKWYERLWMGLNIFTLPAIVIENRHFSSAILRSLYLIIRDIPSIYMKGAQVNVFFFIFKYFLIVINAALGAIIGYFFAYFYGLQEPWPYYIAAAAVPLFLWIGGGTSTIIVNDLNNTYVTILFIHTIDELNEREGYTIAKLQELRGDLKIVKEEPKGPRWYQFKKKRELKKAQQSQKTNDTNKEPEPTLDSSPSEIPPDSV